MTRRTLFRVAGVVLTPLAFLVGVGGVADTLEETGKVAVTRLGMWAVVIAWAVLAGAVAIALVGLLAPATAEPDSAGAIKGIVVLTSFLTILTVGPLVTWRWLRRRLP